jgi:hypothetical protein
VNADELEQLILRHPVLFHMAERGSWPSIRAHGLLSTSALLDLYGYAGEKRYRLESERRAESSTVSDARYGQAVVRDQKPMADSSLGRCLLDGLTPSEWYRMLNARVFFWLTEERLRRLLNAGPYASSSHDVLFVETRELIAKYRDEITLAPINTGNTKPYAQPRGRGTFSSIDDYPYQFWFAKRRGIDPVVELAVTGGISDIERFTLHVKEMRGADVIRTLWTRSG